MEIHGPPKHAPGTPGRCGTLFVVVFQKEAKGTNVAVVAAPSEATQGADRWV